jgi:hypothetical protein
MTDASVVRVWGTSRGLGQIAEGGPSRDTILDRIGKLEFDYLTVVFALDCVQDKWESEL